MLALSPDEAQIEIRTFFAWRPRVLDTVTTEQAWQVHTGLDAAAD